MRFLNFVFPLFLLTSCTTSHIYIVRHGERLNNTDTTSLSAEGHARARLLAEELAGAGIDSIFCTPYLRTQQTAAPLAGRLSRSITTYPVSPTDAIVNRLKRLRGQNALVVGHSNTVLEIVQGLGKKPALAKIEAGDFDNLYEVTLKRGPFGRTVSLRESTYGRPTPP